MLLSLFCSVEPILLCSIVCFIIFSPTVSMKYGTYPYDILFSLFRSWTQIFRSFMVIIHGIQYRENTYTSSSPVLYLQYLQFLLHWEEVQVNRTISFHSVSKEETQVIFFSTLPFSIPSERIVRSSILTSFHSFFITCFLSQPLPISFHPHHELIIITTSAKQEQDTILFYSHLISSLLSLSFFFTHKNNMRTIKEKAREKRNRKNKNRQRKWRRNKSEEWNEKEEAEIIIT